MFVVPGVQKYDPILWETRIMEELRHLVAVREVKPRLFDLEPNLVLGRTGLHWGFGVGRSKIIMKQIPYPSWRRVIRPQRQDSANHRDKNGFQQNVFHSSNSGARAIRRPSVEAP
jgi:hypothetical protein